VKNFIITIALIFLFLTNASASCLQGFRCGVRLVCEGDNQIEVLKKCGEPILVRDGGYIFEKNRSKRVEIWIYNFGSHQFMKVLTFHNGILVKAEDGDYGFEVD
jgi:hypothetical protein